MEASSEAVIVKSETFVEVGLMEQHQPGRYIHIIAIEMMLEGIKKLYNDRLVALNGIVVREYIDEVGQNFSSKY